ncbi:hypothetical protein ACFXDJ_04485 [Streptomyces sp. NPDC059443]|uniref:hypothetical protein n=1 Tax=unclassified Streptomyces TaxID=2593676 RepID=UPI0036AB4C5B
MLEAWNFFEDLARGLHAVHGLPAQGAVHDSAYEKLFAGECGAWIRDERDRVVELLAVGVALWNGCPVLVRPHRKS